MWPVVEPLVADALERAHGEFSPRDIYIALLTQDWQLWIIGEDLEKYGIAVTRIYELPQKKVCELVILSTADGYTLKKMRAEFEPHLRAWATHLGCDVLRASGRDGFEKVMGAGWKKIYTEVECDLWAKEAAGVVGRQPLSKTTPPGQGSSRT